MNLFGADYLIVDVHCHFSHLCSLHTGQSELDLALVVVITKERQCRTMSLDHMTLPLLERFVSVM